MMVSSIIVMPVLGATDHVTNGESFDRLTGGDGTTSPASAATDPGNVSTGSERRGTTGFEPWYYYFDDVNVANGNLHFSETDIALGVRTGEVGFNGETVQAETESIEFVRSYNSHASGEHGAFGFGWTHNFAMQLIDDDDAVVFVDETGSRHVFEQTEDGFDAPTGVHARLNTSSIGYTLDRTDGTTLTFDEDGRLLSVKDHNDVGVTLEYTDGALSQVEHDSGGSLEFSYSDAGRITEIVDSAGRHIEYEYDIGDLVAVTTWDGETSEYEYYENHKLERSIESSGFMTIYGYERGTDRVTFVGSGFSEAQCNEAGNSFVYDDEANTVTIHSHLTGEEATIEMNDVGNPTSVSSPVESLEIEWDEEMNRIAVTDEGETVSYEYDEYGNLEAETDPNGNTIETEWETVVTDSAYHSRLVRHTTASGQTTTFDHDDPGNVVRETTPSGATTERTYGEAGQPIDQTAPTGEVTTFSFDDRGYLESVTDSAGGQTLLAYDDFGRLVNETDPNGHTYEYEYDERGALVTVIDPHGEEIEYLYDANGNLEAIERPVGPDGDRSTVPVRAEPRTVDYDFELEDGVETITGPDVSVTRTFDPRGMLESETVEHGSFERTVGYTYDGDGNLIELETEDGIHSYEYDDAGRIDRVDAGDGVWASYEYDEFDRLTGVTYANGVETTYEYGVRDRLATLQVTNASGATVLEEHYTYDSVGNLLSVTDGDGAETIYTYDELDRLSEISAPDGTDIVYEYDAIGNRLSTTVNGSVETTYEYDDEGRLVARDDVEYRYDENGNLERRTLEVGDGDLWADYEFDSSGRLVDVSYGSSGSADEVPGFHVGEDVSYAYLPDGQRVSETVDGETTYYLYASDHLFGAYDEGGDLETAYLQGLNIDDPVAMLDGSEHYFYHSDEPHNVRALTDEAGQVANEYEYDPFGSVVTETETVENPFKFAGRFFDEETDQYYNRERYYDPTTARFTGPDPLGVSASTNYYAYAENNPLRYTDPFGLDIWDGGTHGGGVDGPSISAGLVKHETERATLRNPTSFQSCDVEIQWSQIGPHIEVNLVGGSVSTSSLAISGPPCGEDLPGQTFYCTGAEGEVQALGGAEVGGFACGGEQGGGGVGSVGVSAGASTAAGFTVAKRGIIVDADCDCALSDDDPAYEDCVCDEDERPPGGDHPDDNHDVSVLTYDSQQPSFGDGFPEYGYENASVAVLNRGFAAELQDYLTAEEIQYQSVDIHTPPEDLQRFSVVIVPSGGFMGVSTLGSFEETLDEYVESGGTLFVLTQPRGYHFDVVPGGLTGYGWLEDQSCHFDAVGMAEYCPAFASQEDERASMNVDGYFLEYPENATILLERTRNNQPSMLTYDHGEGAVIATTAYTDWAYGHQASNPDEEQILRDTVLWAQHGDLETYAPGETISAATDVRSYVDVQIDSTDVRLHGPDGEISTIDDESAFGGSTSLDPFETRTETVTVDAPSSGQNGIWELEYVLQNETLGEVQRTHGAHFAVSQFQDGDGGWERTEANVSVSVQSDAQEYRPSSNATTTAQVFNGGDDTRDLTVELFPHGTTHNVTVPAGGSAEIVETFTVTTDERVVANVYDGEDIVASGFRQLFTTGNELLPLEVSLEESTYARGDEIVADVSLRDTWWTVHEVEEATVTSQVVAPNGSVVAEQTATEDVHTDFEASYEFTLPEGVQSGHYIVSTEVRHDGSVVGFASSPFEVPQQFEVTPSIPATIGSSEHLEFDVENRLDRDASAVTLDVSLLDPDGTTVWGGADSAAIAGNATERFEYEMELEEPSSGEYTLLYSLDSGVESVGEATALTSSVAASADFDQPRYRQGDDLEMELTVVNDGVFDVEPTTTVSIPELGTSETRTVDTLSADEYTVETYTASIPDDTEVGEYDVQVDLEIQDTVSESFTFVVPESALGTSVEANAVSAGESVPVAVSNGGGVETEATCSIELIGPRGLVHETVDLEEPVAAGENETVSLSVPPGALSGQYWIVSECSDGETGATTDRTETVDVSGVSTTVDITTDEEVYTSGETVTGTVELENQGDAIESGRVHLELDRPDSTDPDLTGQSVTTDSNDLEADDEEPVEELASDETSSEESDSDGVDESDGGDALQPSVTGARNTISMAFLTSVQTLSSSSYYAMTTAGASRADSTTQERLQGLPETTLRADGGTMNNGVAQLSTAAPTTINNEQTWTDERRTDDEPIVVTDGGDLTLENTTIEPTHGGTAITVESGGTLTLTDGTVIDSSSPDLHIHAHSGSSVTIQNATVGEWSTGILLETDDATIDELTMPDGDLAVDGASGLTIHGSTFGDDVLFDGVNDLQVTESTFEDDVDLVDSSDVEFLDSEVDLVSWTERTFTLENTTSAEIREFNGLDAVSVEDGSSDVTIEANTIQRWVNVDESSADVVVDDNEFVRTDDLEVESAIGLAGSGATVTANTIEDVDSHGVHVTGDDARVEDNVITGSGVHDVYLQGAENAVLQGNDLSAGSLHVEGHGSGDWTSVPSSTPALAYYDHDIDASNTVDDVPIQYLVGETDSTIESEDAAVWLVDASDVKVTGTGTVAVVHSTDVEVHDLNASVGASYGVFAAYSESVTLENVTSKSNEYGLVALGSDATPLEDLTVTGSDVRYSGAGGIHAEALASGTVTDSESGFNGHGADWRLVGDDLTVVGNQLTDTDNDALFVRGSDNWIEDNEVHRPGGSGILAYPAFGATGLAENTVHGNNVTEVSGFGDRGIELDSSGSTASNNSVSDVDGAAIYANGEDGLVVGNHLEDNQIGIDARDPDVEVRENVIGGEHDDGIVVRDDSVVVDGNDILGATRGIQLTGGSDVLVVDNHVSATEADVEFDTDDPVTLENNALVGSGLAVSSFNAGDADYYRHDVDETNTYRGKPVHLVIDETDVTVPDDAGLVWFVNATDAGSSGSHAVRAIDSSGLTVTDVDATGTDVTLLRTSQSTFDGVSVAESPTIGVTIEDASDLELSGLTVTDSAETALRLEDAPETVFEDVTLEASGEDGFVLDDSPGVELEDALVESSAEDGIGVDGSSDGLTATNVSVAGSGDTGLDLRGDGHVLTNVSVEQGGGTGLTLQGDDYVLTNVSALDNGGVGVDVGGDAFVFETLTVTDNADHGLVLGESDHHLSDVTATGNTGYGLVVNADDSLFETVDASGNDDAWEGSGGIFLEATFSSSASGNEFTDVTADDNDGTGVTLDDADSNTFTDVSANGNEEYGIELTGPSGGSDANTFTDVTASENGDHGVRVHGSTDTALENVTVEGNDASGLLLSSADGNEFTNVSATDNVGHGVDLLGSSQNTVDDVIATGNDAGVRAGSTNQFSTSETNTVTGGTLAENEVGILLDRGGDNTLTGLVVEDNAAYGVEISNSEPDRLYDNVFDNPAATADAVESSENIWNVSTTPGPNIVDGPLVGGNYWAGYEGSDLTDDGFGDTDLPYTVEGNLVLGDQLPLVADVGSAPDADWETNVTVAVDADATETVDVEVPSAALADVGKYDLHATLYTAENQTVDVDVTSFYVFEDETSLTLETDQRTYASGDTVTITGDLHNDGETERTYDLVITDGESEILDEQHTLEPGESYTYEVTTTAEESLELSATADGVTVTESVEVASPEVDARLVTPEYGGLEPFDVGVELENTGSVDVPLVVSLDGESWTVTLEPGESRLLTTETTATDDLSVTATVERQTAAGTAHLETLEETVPFGETATLSVDPPAVSSPGSVAIPYTAESTGPRDVSFTIESTIDDSSDETSVYVPAGESTTGALTTDLEPGEHTLAYTSPYGSGSETVLVAERNQLELDADVPRQSESGVLETTVTLTNTGSNNLSGTIDATTPVANNATAFDVTAGESTDVPVVVPIPDGTAPETYDLVLTASAGGSTLAETETSFVVPGAAFEIISEPLEETYELSEEATVETTVENVGTTTDEARLNLTVPGIAEATDTSVIAPGETDTLSASFDVPDDLEEGTYEIRYEVDDDERETSFDLEGASIDVDGQLDQVAYELDENATLTIDVTNERHTDLELFSRVAFNEYEAVEYYTVNGTETETVTFDVPVTEGIDDKIFFSVYHEGGRSLYIDGAYPNLRGENVTLSTDQQQYEPGDTVTITVDPKQQGELNVAAPGFDWTGTVEEPTDISFEVPPLQSGPHYIHYTFNGETHSLPFDVDGYNARVLDAAFDQSVYTAGETVNLDLELEPTRTVSATVTGQFHDADGNVLLETETTDTLSTDGTTVTLAGELPADTDGIHSVRYDIEGTPTSSGTSIQTHAGQPVFHTSGVNYFDVVDTSSPDEEPPVASFEYDPTDPIVGEEVTFDGGSSTASSDSLLEYNWSFEDGTSQTGSSTTYTFEEVGVQTVTLEVTEDSGQTNTTDRTVDVQPATDDDDQDGQDDDGTSPSPPIGAGPDDSSDEDSETDETPTDRTDEQTDETPVDRPDEETDEVEAADDEDAEIDETPIDGPEEETDDVETTGEGDDRTDSDGIPGFGILITLVALFICVLLQRRFTK